jgi:hypothetical protein
MDNCTEFIDLHENSLGSVGYCYGCDSFHLKMSGLLSVVTEDQLDVIQQSLSKIQDDLEIQKVVDSTVGVQIKITKNTFLCLSHEEVIEALELVDMAKYMKRINDLVL